MRIEAHLSTRTDRIELRTFTNNREYADRLRKAVSGGRFGGAGYDDNLDKPYFLFRYPLTTDTCVQMREAWGTELRVSKRLSDWYRSANVERKAQVERTQLVDTTLPRLSAAYPEFNAWLKGDQRVTASWIANAYRGGGLLADEVGTGKTAGVLAGLVEADIDGPILIVCPKISVKTVWGKEFHQHTPDVPVYMARGTRVSREKAMAAFAADKHATKVLIIVAEMLRVKAVRAGGRIQQFLGYEYPALYDIEWGAVVVDESHRLLGAMDVVKSNLAGEGLKALSYRKDRLKLAVTATPFGKGGRVEAMFGTLHWLWPDEYTSRWQWLGRFFEVTEDRVYVRGGGGAQTTVRKVGGLKGGLTEQSFWGSLGPRILRRRMEDVSPEHKGLKNYVEVICEMEARQAKQYKNFTENAELVVQGGIISTVGVLDFLTRCRQFANGVLRKEGGRVVYTGESGKLDRFMAHLDQLDPTRKVVVSSQYNEFLDVVEARLLKEGIGYWRLDGKTSEAKREEMMRCFQDPARIEQPVFLLNSQAGGVSITLDQAEELHQLDEMYPPEANTQLYGRIFRRGRVHEIFLYLYRSEGTIDEVIGHNVGEGHAAQLRVLDGRLGREYVRTLAQYHTN